MNTDTDYYKIVYHVFTDGLDARTEELDYANSLFDEWGENGSARLYEQRFDTKEDYEDGSGELNEDCIRSVGWWPR